MEEPPKLPKTSEAPQVDVSQESTKPVKEKKPRSEKQQAATAKALAAMTAKRKEINESRKEKKEQVKQAKKVVEEKILKEDLKLPSTTDIDALRKELAELRGMVTMKQQYEKEKPVAKPAERIVERVIERVPTQVAQPTKLSGHALLDSIFFK